MIQHVMLWNYKDDVSSEHRAHIEAELAALPGRIPTLLSLAYGPVVGGRNQSFDHCFVMRFTTSEDLAEYNGHPEHQKFAAMFREACAVQVVADFEEVSALHELG
jgi:hypothetical protein